MTDSTKLIERLRGVGPVLPLAHEAADLIEQQAARIAALESENKELGEFVVAVGGFWGNSRSTLIGEHSLSENINRAFAELKSAQAVCDSYAEENQRLSDRIAALESAAKAAVPEGWKPVPIKLTPSMADAYRRYWAHTQNIYGAWAVMLAAAPAAIDDGGGRDAEDARRYRWLRDTLHGAKAGGGVEVNDALQIYEKPEPGKEVRVYWYQDTPVGFYESEASTLDEAIDAALSQKAGE